MAKQYWLGNYYVDLTRNQITQNKLPQKLPPKALAVLTYLARHANKVVSHDELMDHVWPDTIVTPNTLQRCIAQLRKVLDTDKTTDSFIKTHSKQGYSLECDVRWDDPDISNDSLIDDDDDILDETLDDKLSDVQLEQDIDILEQAEHSLIAEPDSSKRPYRSWFIWVAALFCIALLGALLISRDDAVDPIVIKSIKPITASIHKEYDASYTPDGKYITFHRYRDKLCINNIWAKNVESQSEIQLTRTEGTYSDHSISPNGETMAFVEETDCSKPLTQPKCFNLLSIDFKKAINSPVEPNLLMQCKHTSISRPVWVDNHHIILLQKVGARGQLVRYSVKDNTSTVISAANNGNITYFDYSASQQLIAVLRTQSDNRVYIELLKPNGELLSSNPIQYLHDMSKYRKIFPSFVPNKNYLVFSSGRQLYSLNFEGEINKIGSPMEQRIRRPNFHTNGKQMLVIKGHYDSSIARMAVSDDIESQPLTDAVQSVASERGAIFQPNGRLIAYESSRTGEDQIWLADGNKTEQLSQFPLDNFIFGFRWADDGKSLLVNSDHTLTQIFLDKTYNPAPVDFPVQFLFHWQSNNNTALANVRVNGITKFAEIDLTSGKVNIISEQPARWAAKLTSGEILYMDARYQFWQEGTIEYQQIHALEGYGSNQRFVIEDNTLYGVSADNELWAFSLNDKTLMMLTSLPENIKHINDINGTQILISTVESSRKSVVEMVLE